MKKAARSGLSSLGVADGLRTRTSYLMHTIAVEPQLRWRLPRLRPLWSSG